MLAEKVLRKHVAIIHAYSMMSALQRKIVNVLLYQAIHTKNDDRNQGSVAVECLMPFSKLAKAVNFNSNNTQYLKEAIDGLASLKIEWNLLKDKAPTDISFLNLRILHGSPTFYQNGEFNFSFHKFMLDLAGNPPIYGTIDIDIQAQLENYRSGFRKLPGTELKNELTGEVVYIPPQNPQDVVGYMNNLESFINDDSLYDVDPLIKMAIIHYQFESIHPFYDGNGRTGRIINVLYMVLKQLLDIPVLYLSRYIVKNKSDYYRLIQKVRDEDQWEDWILFMLEAVETTSQQTILIIKAIRVAILDYKHQIRSKHKFYSQDLINNLFYHPYTKIDFLMRDLKVSRLTATKYLDILSTEGLLEKKKNR